MTRTDAHIERIPPSRRAEAGRVLAGRGADRAAGERLLRVAGSHGVSFDDFWGVSRGPGEPYRSAALLVPASGGTLMVYASPITSAVDAGAVAATLERACESVRVGKVAQTLLDPADTWARQAFERSGFLYVGDLLYLRRAWSDPGDGAVVLPGSVRIEPWRDGLEADLAAALDRTYQDTLDCPELCGLRETADVISSHRATGEFDPSLWWLVRHHGQPAGAMLLNPNPAQDHTELVYLGLAKPLRGRGLADDLLRMGLSSLRLRAHRTALCAVDARNTPACRLYQRAGFHEFSRRVAMVRPIGIGRAPATVAG